MSDEATPMGTMPVTAAASSPTAADSLPEEPSPPVDPENGRSTPSGGNHRVVCIEAEAIAVDAETQKDLYIKKLDLKVSGFIDLSGLIATFAVLVLLLSQPNRNEYFLPVMVFIFLSMILQCILAVILVIRHNTIDSEAHVISGTGGLSTEERNWYIRESRRLLTVSSISLIFITVFNILIAAFVGLAGASKTLSSDCPT